MEKMFFNMVDSMCEDCLVHTHIKDVWVINPDTKEWIIYYYPPTKYLWWNYDFFENIYKYLSMDIKDRDPITNWVKYVMNVEVGNCEPDKLPGDYDWSCDFTIDHVISGGELLIK
jgi:hypothetical protein